MTLPRRCPLCLAGEESQLVVTGHVYGDSSSSRAFFHCQKCDVRYQFPGLTNEEELQFYTAEFEKFMANRSGDAGGWLQAEEHIVANELTRQRRMKYLLPYLKDNIDILEIGCSSGFMLFPLKENGFNCIGIEPSGVFGDFVKNRGLKTYQSLEELKNSSQNFQFDLILHFFVLEHIADPTKFLKTQLDILKPGGHIIFEVPNVADPLYSIYDIPEFERFYWSVAHPWYFSEMSLKYLMYQITRNSSITRDQRYDLSNHIIWARDGRPGGMNRFTNKLGEEAEESYKQSLIRSGYCDTLIGIIKKED